MTESSWEVTKHPDSLCPDDTKSGNQGRTTQWNVNKRDEKSISRSFKIYIPPNFCSNSVQNDDSIPQRIILAFHGYGGRPVQEIKKWQGVADSLNSVIIAPMGTETTADHKLGWNAIECCGDPVKNEIDDLDFVIHGVMEIFVSQFSFSGKSISNSESKRMHVIATGFSNGGFFTSLLGIVQDRPEWLVGIIPTGGYQYDIEAYSNVHQPLAVFMHHGGKDSVVNPNGCCITNEPGKRKGSSKSNCLFDIGKKQEKCQSIQSVFQIWTQINGCSTDNFDGRSEKKYHVDSIVESECFMGSDCVEPTNFCMWTNEGHSWGATFPGAKMMEIWMKDVFSQAETKTLVLQEVDSKASLATPKHHGRVGKSMFSSASSILLGFIILVATCSYFKRRNFTRTSHKRKVSEEEERILGHEMVVLSSDKHPIIL